MKVEKQIKWGERIWMTHAWGSRNDPNSGFYSYICKFYNLRFYQYSASTNYNFIFNEALNEIKKIPSKHFQPCFDYILIDCPAGIEQGFKNAIAGLGTALTPEQVTLISRYAEEVYLCYDSDEAGQKAVKAALALFSKTGVKVKVIMLSGGKDPDEILRNQGGQDKFQTLIDNALNAVEYYLHITKAKYNLQTADGRKNYLNDASKILARTVARAAPSMFIFGKNPIPNIRRALRIILMTTESEPITELSFALLHTFIIPK